MDEMTTDVEVSSTDSKVQAALLAVKGLGTMFAIVAGVAAGIAASKKFNETIEDAAKKKLGIE